MCENGQTGEWSTKRKLHIKFPFQYICHVIGTNRWVKDTKRSNKFESLFVKCEHYDCRHSKDVNKNHIQIANKSMETKIFADIFHIFPNGFRWIANSRGFHGILFIVLLAFLRYFLFLFFLLLNRLVISLSLFSEFSLTLFSYCINKRKTPSLKSNIWWMLRCVWQRMKTRESFVCKWMINNWKNEIIRIP